MTRRVFNVVIFLCLVLPFSSGSAGEVSEGNLMSHVRFLASEGLQGRRAGELGDKVAESYVQAVFEQLNLEPIPALGDYRQQLIALESTLDRDNTLLVITDETQSHYFPIDQDIFYILNRHSDLDIEAPLVFAGFGITAPEYGYDDYSGLDVEGKIALVLDNEPGDNSGGDAFRGRAPTRHSFAATKERVARKNGAVGVIVVNNAASGHPDLDVTLPRRYRREMEQPFFGVEQQDDRIPVFHATQALVGKIMDLTAVDLIEVQKRIDKNMKPASRSLPGVRARMSVRLARVEEKKTANIIAYLEGGDEALREEFIVIGAHHDHLGSLADGTIYFGADDNASGTAGLLESARLLALQTGELGRSVLFVSFCAEELGLVGSKYFIEHLPVPREKIRLLINMDMIGRNNMDKVENSKMFIAFPSAQTPALAEILRTEAKELDIDVRVAPYVRFHGASDHVVFHDQGIPVIHYFGGFHSDYSSTEDTVYRINSGKMALVVEHLCRVAAAVCNDAAVNLEFDGSITEEPAKDSFENPYSR